MTAFDVASVLAEFLADADRTSLELPHMTTGQRKSTKKLLEDHPELRCESYGFGAERQLHIFKRCADDAQESCKEINAQMSIPSGLSSAAQCSRCGEAGHLAVCCPKPFIRPQCSHCKRLGHVVEECPKKREADKQARQAATQARQAATVCFRCGLQGHRRDQCPLTEKELTEKRRLDRLASTVCFKCGKVGHVRADCTERDSDVQSNATGISDTQLSASTAATARDVTVASKTAPAARTCGFCGTVQRAPTYKVGAKVSHDRCQTCWRLPSDLNASQ